MIIWRGFGFLAVLIGAVGALIGFGLSSAVAAEGEINGLMLGLGLLLGAAGIFALGWWLNVINPAKKAETWTEQRRAELNFAIANGQFQAVPGVAPSSQEQAQAQADAMLAQESVTVGKRLRNIHTLFWIPMQWIGVVLAIIAVLVAITV
ncbi:hypothetical protein [Pseudactinotalea sp.]|uniref:hypothetical protein n=1 Tax=Pseudactinotalea sp. TaxID=1926260 RepID=UPI003B3AAD4B